MSKSYLFRLVSLGTALTVVAVLTLWTVQQSLRRIDSLERRLNAGLLESFRLANDFRSRLERLNNLMLRYAAQREPSALGEFQSASNELNDWIDHHDPELNPHSSLTSKLEQDLFHQLNNAYDDYLRAAGEVISNATPVTVPAGAFAQLARFNLQSQNLMDVSGKLAEAHEKSQQSFLEETDHALAVLRGLLVAAILVIFALVAGLGAVSYRDLIAPLRVRLVQSEALLKRQEKLATLGTLAAGIAHEIRNPLTSIKARLYTLGKHIKGNASGLADAQIISDEITRLERIVQDVLSFARPSEPKMVRVPADLPLQEVQSLMAGALEKNGVHLVLEKADDVLVSVDLALIKQVLINLVRNASEAITGAGTVTLRVRTDRAMLQGAERAVAILEVADTGKGIPPEIEARLFDPFFTTKESGTGLGLSIAARIVEKHGGQFQYQTRAGHGTTFGIVLPSAGPASGDAPTNPPAT